MIKLSDEMVRQIKENAREIADNMFEACGADIPHTRALMGYTTYGCGADSPHCRVCKKALHRWEDECPRCGNWSMP
jgi:hypothetical protein